MKHRQLSVEDVMTTALVTARPDLSVDEAAQEMRLASIRHIPVIDHHHLVGIVSQRDILRAMARPEAGGLPLREVMTARVLTIAREAPAARAADVMLQHKIGCLPVVGDEGQVIGLVTESDFVRLARDLLADGASAQRARRMG
jgi:CBS domain-containing protein